MDSAFLKRFYKVAEKVEKLDRVLYWEISGDLRKRISEGEQKIRPWQIPRSTGEFLRFLVVASKAKNILELGTSIGYSALWLGLGAMETGGRVYTIEIFRPKIELAKRHIKEAGLEKYITVIEGDILKVLRRWKKNLDFVFIDAKKEEYVKYYNLVVPRLKAGGVLVADNVSNFSYRMKDFIRMCREDKKVVSSVLEIDHGLMLCAKVK